MYFKSLLFDFLFYDLGLSSFVVAMALPKTKNSFVKYYKMTKQRPMHAEIGLIPIRLKVVDTSMLKIGIGSFLL